MTFTDEDLKRLKEVVARKRKLKIRTNIFVSVSDAKKNLFCSVGIDGR